MFGRGRPLLRGIVVLVGILAAGRARAGGLEYPDNGSEGMGRGAAFTAKADDGTALIYNVAGFARQRGTRLTVGANLALHSAEFQRAGVYPDSPTDPLTPWGGQPFPLVKSAGAPLPIPHLVLSSDLGTDRFTAAAGVYAPSVVGGRVFPLGVGGKPSPARYDATRSGGLIAYPSLAAAYRVSEWLDIGAAVNLVVANLEATSMSSADLAKAICPNQEYQPCDTRQTVKTSGGTVALSVGGLVRPTPWLQIGAQLRTPHTLETEGTVEAKAPAVQPATLPPGKAFLTQAFPWIFRTGVRYISLKGKFEVWDAELDFTYEAWGSALGEGTKVYVPKLSVYENIRSTIQLGFQDTMSFRAGGAYNFPFAGGVMTLRAGAYHDTAATKPENTRLIFDTLAKTGITAGLGIKQGAVSVNLAVANIFHESREVTNGAVRPINGAQGGQPVDGDGKPYEPINNGTYTASTFVVSLGVMVQLEELFGKKRVPDYGADYELTQRDLGKGTPREPPPADGDPTAPAAAPERSEPRSVEPTPSPEIEMKAAPAESTAAATTDAVAPAPTAASEPPPAKEKRPTKGGKRPRKPRSTPKKATRPGANNAAARLYELD